MSMSMPRSVYDVLCDLLFVFSLIFMFINHIISLNQTHLFFVHFLEYLLIFLDDNEDEERYSRSLASGCCLAFVCFLLISAL